MSDELDVRQRTMTLDSARMGFVGGPARAPAHMRRRIAVKFGSDLGLIKQRACSGDAGHRGTARQRSCPSLAVRRPWGTAHCAAETGAA